MSTLHYKYRFIQIQSFSLVLPLNMIIVTLVFYSIAGTVVNRKWKYKFEIAWADWTVILFPTVIWLCMKLESSTLTSLCRCMAPNGSKQDYVGQNKLCHLTCHPESGHGYRPISLPETCKAEAGNIYQNGWRLAILFWTGGFR